VLVDRDDQRARAAESAPLDVDVRAVGREVRAYNLAAAANRAQEVAQARARVATAVAAAIRHDAEPLLSLRAYQMLGFVKAVRAWERSGEVSEDLWALGGDFLYALGRNRWCRGSSRELLMDDGVLRALFKARWNEITGLREAPFALSLDEDRLRYGFLLEHPFMRADSASSLPIDEALFQARRGEAQLAVVDRLSSVDPDYPRDLARGVIFYRLGRYGLAVEHFRRHLELAPDGPYTLRVHNYLKAALDRTGEGSV
jgi:hypothetical protein